MTKKIAHKKKTIEKNFKGLMGADIRWKRIPRKGRGVFTMRAIKKGEIVEVAPAVPLSKRAVPDKIAPDGYVLDWDDDNPRKAYAMVLGYIMLYNHSEDPNIELESDLSENTITAVAMRNIKAGEELTWDYGVELWFTAR